MNQEFKTFVEQNVNANEKMVVIKKLEVIVIPEFAALFLKKINMLSNIQFILKKFYRRKRKVWKISEIRKEEKVLGNGTWWEGEGINDLEKQNHNKRQNIWLDETATKRL